MSDRTGDGGAFARWLGLAAMVLAIAAITTFVVILIMGYGGQTDIAEAFGRVGIVLTVLGICTASWAATKRESRAPAVVSLAILAPCVLLAAISLLVLLT